MTKTAHKIYLSILAGIVFLAFITLVYRGMSYYNLSLEERFYHPNHNLLKPSGIWGHGFGITGTLLIIIGVSSYMARKRYSFMLRLGLLKHWLEFHIFLCTLGPILILFHTALKFGGLVAISFWSMVAVFLSGIVGRFIYIQIPHSTEGRELSLNEVRAMKSDAAAIIKNTFSLDEETSTRLTDSLRTKFELYNKNSLVRYFTKYFSDRKTLSNIRILLKETGLPKGEVRKIIVLAKEEIFINRRIERLDTMKNMFKYWHVVHSPFALVMLIIMIIHVAVTIVFGYRWIF